MDKNIPVWYANSAFFLDSFFKPVKASPIEKQDNKVKHNLNSDTANSQGHVISAEALVFSSKFI